MKISSPQIGIIVAVGVVLIGVGVYFHFQADRIDPASPNNFGTANWSQVEEGLYMGGLVAEPPPGTRAVINLCEHEDPYKAEFHEWPWIRDASPAPSLAWLREQVERIDQWQRAGIPTYVHCAGGISRCGMVVTAYEMAKNNWTRDDALTYIRSKRPQVRPNPAFMELLLQWQDERSGKPQFPKQ